MKRACIAIAALWIPAAGAAYKCVDDRGLTHIGDTPPPGCASVMMYEVTPGGKVIRQIEPTLNPEQLKARQVELERKKEADKQAAEQKRKDMALLNTYGSEKEFDVARDRNIEPIRTRIVQAQERIKAVEKRQKELEDEMEFYKAGKGKTSKKQEMPASLGSEHQRITSEKTLLVASIAGYEKEIDQLKAKFETDKKRWIDLKSGSVAKPAEFVSTDKSDKKN